MCASGFTTKSYFYHFQSYDEFLAGMLAGARAAHVALIER